MSQIGNSRVRKFAIPLAVAGAVLGVAGITIASSDAATQLATPLAKPLTTPLATPLAPPQAKPLTTPQAKQQVILPQARLPTPLAPVAYSHTTGDGTSFQTKFDGKNFTVPLKDGTYKLVDNGGQIKVQGGRVVWDAFGVVKNFNKTGKFMGISPDG
jgi:hypothetical protein